MLPIFFLFLIVPAQLAHASVCALLLEAMINKAAAYNYISLKNENQLASLENTLKQCREEGAQFSAQLARTSQALSCEGIKDAISLDQKMSDLGEECQEIIDQIEEIQETLVANFLTEKQDLDEAVQILNSSNSLRRACQEEAPKVAKVYNAFQELAPQLNTVEIEAGHSSADYGQFAFSALELKKNMTSPAERCGIFSENQKDSTVHSGKNISAISSRENENGPRGNSQKEFLHAVSGASTVTGRINEDSLAPLERGSRLGRPGATAQQKTGTPLGSFPSSSPNLVQPIGKAKHEDDQILVSFQDRNSLGTKKNSDSGQTKREPSDFQSVGSSFFVPIDLTKESLENTDANTQRSNTKSAEELNNASRNIASENEVRFLGEITDIGPALAASSLTTAESEASLFERVKRVYRERRQELKMQKSARTKLSY